MVSLTVSIVCLFALVHASLAIDHDHYINRLTLRQEQRKRDSASRPELDTFFPFADLPDSEAFDGVPEWEQENSLRHRMHYQRQTMVAHSEIHYNVKFADRVHSLDKNFAVRDVLCPEHGLYMHVDDQAENPKRYVDFNGQAHQDWKAGNIISSGVAWNCRDQSSLVVRDAAAENAYSEDSFYEHHRKRSPPTQKFESNALYRRVTGPAVELGNGVVYVPSVAITFLECFSEGDIKISHKPSSHAFNGTNKAEALKNLREHYDREVSSAEYTKRGLSLSWNALEAEFNYVWELWNFNYVPGADREDLGYTKTTEKFQFACTSCYSYAGISFDFSMKIQHFLFIPVGLKSMKFTVTPLFTSRLAYSLDFNTSEIYYVRLPVIKDLNLGSITIPLGPVPLTLEFSGSLDFSFKVETHPGALKLTHDIGYRFEYILGFGYDESQGWHTINTMIPPRFAFPFPEIDSSATSIEFTAALHPQLDVVVATIVPAELVLMPYLSFVLDWSDNHCPKGVISYSTYWGLDLSVGLGDLKIPIIGITLPTAFSKSFPLVPKRPLGCDACAGCIGQTDWDSGDNLIRAEDIEGDDTYLLRIVRGSGYDCFSFFSEWNECDLQVKVRHCRLVSLSDPPNCEGWKSTNVVKNDNSPYWGASFAFFNVGPADKLEFQLYDDDKKRKRFVKRNAAMAKRDDHKGSWSTQQWCATAAPCNYDKGIGGGSISYTISKISAIDLGVFSSEFTVQTGQNFIFFVAVPGNVWDYAARLRIRLFPLSGNPNVYSKDGTTFTVPSASNFDKSSTLGSGVDTVSYDNTERPPGVYFTITATTTSKLRVQAVPEIELSTPFLPVIWYYMESDSYFPFYFLLPNVTASVVRPGSKRVYPNGLIMDVTSSTGDPDIYGYNSNAINAQAASMAVHATSGRETLWFPGASSVNEIRALVYTAQSRSADNLIATVMPFVHYTNMGAWISLALRNYKTVILSEMPKRANTVVASLSALSDVDFADKDEVVIRVHMGLLEEGSIFPAENQWDAFQDYRFTKDVTDLVLTIPIPDQSTVDQIVLMMELPYVDPNSTSTDIYGMGSYACRLQFTSDPKYGQNTETSLAPGGKMYFPLKLPRIEQIMDAFQYSNSTPIEDVIEKITPDLFIKLTGDWSIQSTPQLRVFVSDIIDNVPLSTHLSNIDFDSPIDFVADIIDTSTSSELSNHLRLLVNGTNKILQSSLGKYLIAEVQANVFATKSAEVNLFDSLTFPFPIKDENGGEINFNDFNFDINFKQINFNLKKPLSWLNGLFLDLEIPEDKPDVDIYMTDLLEDIPVLEPLWSAIRSGSDKLGISFASSPFWKRGLGKRSYVEPKSNYLVGIESSAFETNEFPTFTLRAQQLQQCTATLVNVDESPSAAHVISGTAVLRLRLTNSQFEFDDRLVQDEAAAAEFLLSITGREGDADSWNSQVSPLFLDNPLKHITFHNDSRGIDIGVPVSLGYNPKEAEELQMYIPPLALRPNTAFSGVTSTARFESISGHSIVSYSAGELAGGIIGGMFLGCFLLIVILVVGYFVFVQRTGRKPHQLLYGESTSSIPPSHFHSSTNMDTFADQSTMQDTRHASAGALLSPGASSYASNMQDQEPDSPLVKKRALPATPSNHVSFTGDAHSSTRSARALPQIPPPGRQLPRPPQ